MSWTKGHGGQGWRDVKGSRAEVRKTDNGWWQVREKGGDHVAFSTRDSDEAWEYAGQAFSIYVPRSADPTSAKGGE